MNGLMSFMAFMRGGVMALLVFIAVYTIFTFAFEPTFALAAILVLVLGLCIGGLISLFLIWI